MEALPQPDVDRAAVAPARNIAERITPAQSVSLADANSAGMRTAPPHLLWKTLESAFSGPEISPSALYGPPIPQDRRLAGYIALPIALGLSLVLWVVIVELVLTR